MRGWLSPRNPLPRPPPPPPRAAQYQQLAKTGVAAGLPSGLRQSETGLRFPPGANGGAGAAAAAAAGDPDGPLAQALNKVAELGEEEEQVDSGDSVDYRQFDVRRRCSSPLPPRPK